MFTGFVSFWKKLIVILVVSTLITGCVGQAYSWGQAQYEAGRAAESGEFAISDTNSNLADTGQPTVSFQLKTLLTAGRMTFVGVGGDLDGKVNPDLAVYPGDVVEIVLVNGDGLQPHRLAIPALNLTSPAVAQKGQEARLVFKVEKEGVYSYHCADPRHREAGMEGRLIAGRPAEAGTAASAPAAAAPGHATADHGKAAEATVSFKVQTGFSGGKMSFVGLEGDLEGQVNPDLIVEPGDVVEIILVNGDGVLHNVAIPDLGVTSADITQQGEETRLVFTAGQEGTFAYICAIPGHRQAGMEGRLIVGQAVESDLPDLPSVTRPAGDLPGPLDRSSPEHLRVDLETVEVEARLADGTSFTFWTFNGKVPGPFIRVRAGDTVDVFLKNAADSSMPHSVDFHAVTGPGGGAVATQTQPGGETSFTFKALNPGLYVYHCATPMVAHHIANGMYGLILVEPEGGLPAVDREFYVMQGEIYTAEPLAQKGAVTFSEEKLLDEAPEYFVFNGSVGGLTAESPLQAQVGETVRIFFGVGGPNFTSSFHVIGEIFDRVYDQGSLTSPPLTDVQTTIVPTGGAAMVEFTLEVPGRYILVDHSLSRLERGLAGFLLVEGPEAPEIYHGEPTEGSGH